MLFITIQPDGTLTETEAEAGKTYPVLSQAVGGMIEPINWDDDLVSYHNEEFLYTEGAQFDNVNLAVSLLSGGQARIYVPVIFTGGVDDEGDTTGLSPEQAEALRELAMNVRVFEEGLRAAYQFPRQDIVPVFTITTW